MGITKTKKDYLNITHWTGQGEEMKKKITRKIKCKLNVSKYIFLDYILVYIFNNNIDRYDT